ncbi:thiamine ABC transporter substrate-binding protein [Nocardioides sp. GY 10127]|uniref:thiamine ABC transporter substrate-binding protein n=1 Tax=Nocardioides sp. GY 10127 TaxID=2569762 RepID=UPI0010A9198E|nr:thiamine ABC transporter substrate-binding protein [Nocardioides sp. GY 10127]TIC79377.1 thiamine ABC transporter substrate-binding protein [Nocardioides sp. GY 10127]
MSSRAHRPTTSIPSTTSPSKARPSTPRTLRGLALASTLALLASGCSLLGSSDDSESDSASADPGAGSGGTVTLVTHDSFYLPKKLIKQFETETGYTLKVRSVGDGGTLTSQLVLSQDDPIGDVAFGVDNTFGSRALDADVFAPNDLDLPDGVADHALDGDDDATMDAVDTASVCVNVDDDWFAQHDIDPPTSLDDLTDPTYKNLFVTSGATTSSPGFAFLLTTIAAYGDDWKSYWQDLLDNGMKVDRGWEDAYEVDFTAGGGNGSRPIVLSYDSSPAFTTDGNGGTTTSALLDTCFQQTEYAGVLTNADNPEGGTAVVQWLLSDEVQAALPESMYVFPTVDGTALPKAWAKFAVQPTDPWTVSPAEIAKNRNTWLTDWQDLVSG